VQPQSATNSISSSRFQSSPVPKDGCNAKQQYSLLPTPHVSILTRPEGRVQPSAQPASGEVDAGFQSSPVPKDGCNSLTSPSSSPLLSCFNPHPSRRTGATPLNTTVLFVAVSFNPHPSRRTGATGRVRPSSC